jgi:hypothetical protein
MVLLMGIVGCTSFYEESDLCGTYIAEYSFGKELLTLDSSMTYLQEVIIWGRIDTVRCGGNWKYDKTFGDIVLEDGLAILRGSCDELDKDYDKPISGFESKGITQFGPWGRIRLSTGCEGKYLIKTD